MPDLLTESVYQQLTDTQVRNWDTFIEIEADKVAQETRKRLSSRIEQNNNVSKEIGSEIDRILNKVTRREVREYGAVELIRNDETHREWETAFAVVNMAGNPVVSLISSGYYLQAITLVRQELEGLAQLKHIAQGNRTKNKAPKINVLDEEVKKLYGDLSEGAHLASHDITAIQAPMPTGLERRYALLPHGPSIIPRYSHEVADAIFEMHIKIREELNDSLREHISKLFHEG